MVLKAWWLTYVNFLFDHTVKKCALYVHLIHLEFLPGCKRQKHSYSFQACNRCIDFIVVDSLNLMKTLYNQTSFVSHYNSSIILLTLKQIGRASCRERV